MLPAVSPLGREHDEVERVRRLHLEPAAATAARLVRRVEGLHHHTLVTALERIREKALGLRKVIGFDARHEQFLGDPLGEAGEPLPSRTVEQVHTVDVEAVEEERRKRDALTQRLHPAPAAEAAHGHLEREGTPFAVEGDHLTVQNRGPERKLPQSIHHFRHTIGDVGEVSGVRTYVVAEHVHLQASAVELPFHRCLSEATERVGEIGSGLREHGLDRLEQREPDLLQAFVP
jgi:hypothetical protein